MIEKKSSHRYSIPFKKGSVIEIEAPYHMTDESMYNCIDFFLPEGEPICSSRDGIVVEAVGHHKRRSFRPRKEVKANYIEIKHSDGEISFYAHLKKVQVGVGQKVARGQIIGLNGKTGYAWYPHLHFGVYQKGKNIKIQFDEKIDKKISYWRALVTGLLHVL